LQAWRGKVEAALKGVKGKAKLIGKVSPFDGETDERVVSRSARGTYSESPFLRRLRDC
jgi:hypothetical protein